jgi:SulP family sulfate permease
MFLPSLDTAFVGQPLIQRLVTLFLKMRKTIEANGETRTGNDEHALDRVSRGDSTAGLPATWALPKLDRPAWFSPSVARVEILSGLVVALALIPEAISFSIVAHVDPRIGLFASFTMAVTIAIVGGRPAMISAATGAVALVVSPLVHAHGLGFLTAAVILGGALQVVLGLAGVANLMRFVPRSVMVGFVNALAILIFIAQANNFISVPWLVYPVLLGALAVMVLLPRLTTAIPPPLVAIVLLTLITVSAHVAIPTVKDKGELPHSLPALGLPQIPYSWHTFSIIAPYSVAIAFVGLMESLMTARLVDEITDTDSSKTRESWGQGIANMVTGFFGGMGGCGMIGQTMINVKAGARTRLSTFLAGVFLLILVVSLGGIVGKIPMGALAAVMIMVCVSTFDWHSIKPSTLRRLPRSETAVMLLTVAVVVITGDLAIGVAAGVIASSVLFARRVAHLVQVTGVTNAGETEVVYTVQGELFFASSNDLITQFNYNHDPARVTIDMSEAHVWDASSVAALETIESKYAARGKYVTITGLNEPSTRLRTRLSGHLNR